MRDFTKFDSNKPAKEIDDLNLEEKIKNYSEINEKYDKYDFLHQNIMEVLNNNAPVREHTRKGMKMKKKTWITKGILKSTQTKNILLKHFLTNKDRLIFLRYKTCKDKINHLNRKSRRDYYNKYFH